MLSLPSLKSVANFFTVEWVQKVLSEGSHSNKFLFACCCVFCFFLFVFFLMRGGGSKYHYKWADDGPTLNSGLVALCFPKDPDQYC